MYRVAQTPEPFAFWLRTIYYTQCKHRLYLFMLETFELDSYETAKTGIAARHLENI